MNISEYDYKYPENAVALFPPKKRGNSKLFVIDAAKGKITVDMYSNLHKYLNKGDLIVRNTTKVIKARIPVLSIKYDLKEDNNPAISILLLEPHAISFEEFLKSILNAKSNSFRIGFLAPIAENKLNRIQKILLSDQISIVNLERIGAVTYGDFIVEDKNPTCAFIQFIDQAGKVPIPPYLKRESTELDETRYQTVFAKIKGSVAAPTASLNFTKQLERNCLKAGLNIADVTLHVGLGTFEPLRNDIIEENKLHPEYIEILLETQQAILKTRENGNKICAVGTTVTRTIETALRCAQFSKETIVKDTSLFIYPPYEFKGVDYLLTNFHWPKSSLIVLVDAFLQWKESKLNWREIYNFAINEHKAKIFSYGDSMLIL